MCGRYSLALATEQFEEFLEFPLPYDWDWAPRYNIAPSQILPVLKYSDSRMQLDQLKWGFHPDWLKESGNVPPPINIRGETMATKPYFRKAFKESRCLVPATSFFEWASGGKASSKRVPFKISLLDKKAFYFAGLWENGTFAVVTTDANKKIEKLHHRMPVIFDQQEQADLWLKGSLDVARALVKPFDAERTLLQEVSTLVNSTSNDSEDVLKESGQLRLL